MFTSVILKEDILDQRYVLVWKRHTQVLDVRPPKSTSKTTALRWLYKKNASKYGLSQASFLSLCRRTRDLLISQEPWKEKHRGWALSLWSLCKSMTKSVHHPRLHDLLNPRHISPNDPETTPESRSKALFWINGAAQTDLLWRELLIATSLAVDGKLMPNRLVMAKWGWGL